jgi:hypothetical protein
MARVHACARCQTRLIVTRGVPPLNAAPDPAGTVAARQTAAGGWVARFLASGEEPERALVEKRYSIHTCGQVADAVT